MLSLSLSRFTTGISLFFVANLPLYSQQLTKMTPPMRIDKNLATNTAHVNRSQMRLLKEITARFLI
jgi:hypothetical protein